ncbi:hypothetical protein KKC17_02790 [Patescibacteria group bacterium]|nr:hypothetical protein [Patescibacteria group bacterium]
MSKIKKQEVNNILISLSEEAKVALRPLLHVVIQKNNRSIYATQGTKKYFNEGGTKGMIVVAKFSQNDDEEFLETIKIQDVIKSKLVSLIINIPSGNFEKNEYDSPSERTDGETIRQLACDYGIPLITCPKQAFDVLYDLAN